MNTPYAHIFQPLTVKRTTLRNRIIMPPMGSNYATFTGEVSEEMKDYYGLRAKGGTALITVENACIDYPLATNGTKQLRIDKKQFIPGLYELTERIHLYGALASIQLNHAGASAYPERLNGLQAVSSSSVPSKEGNPAPRPLTKQEILAIVDKYAKAAENAVAAGFDMVEIHGGHSYLLDQFLSPLYNKRTDEFGGCYENRARFARLVVEAVRAAVGKWIPISFRISADEFIKGGNTLEDTLMLLEFIEPEVDIINVSAAVNDSLQYQIDKCDMPDGWRAYLSEAVRKKFGKPVIISGNIRDPKIADDIIAQGKSDLIAMGRGLIADPDWVRKVQSGHVDCLRKCISCNIGCADHRIAKSKPIRCTINPAVIEGEQYRQKKVTRPLHVVVIGAGTGGLETACTAAEVGCRVTLIERDKEVGGMARRIARFPEKSRIEDFPAYLEKRAAALPNLTLKLNTTATKELLTELQPDILYAATGSKPMLPPIEGLRELTDAEGSAIQSIEGFMKNIPYFEKNAAGKNVVIIGCGAVGLDVMEFFALRKARVTMIEMMPSFGKDADVVSKQTFKELLATHPVAMHLGTSLQKVLPHTFIASKDGQEAAYPFDYGFICMGLVPDIPSDDPFRTYATEHGIPFDNIGNSRKTGQIIHGVESGRSILQTIDMIGGFDA
ncbi:FAD-dependent oxidoreductase [Megasphaera vaginalis (ex Srinivasan et al. 2021)]|uniref:Putative NADH oxidase n=1 Tax=Megasphaera vaginalis (ex Srinivasan et al. 2021) TaxID=1111454 RepID=U7UHU2_9FIRM|nr:FAD-dependent oxidoreductase [Megasphaera vaginalis (ex Srinivasan et al. 2021)]ERT58018.1 putative NADH oxidase [Megasphaera vaginalis (ex Srinivasan et al. 2021)]